MNLLCLLLIISGFTYVNPLARLYELQDQYRPSHYLQRDHRYFNPWTWTFTGPEGGDITAALCHPAAGNTVMALSMGDVWRSIDAGSSWSVCLENCLPQAGVLYAANKALVVDAAGQVWVTMNNGGSWTQTLVLNNYLAGSFETPDSVIFLCDSTPPRVRRSTNGGLSWQIVGEIANLEDVDQIAFIPGSASYLWVAGREPGNDSTTLILNSQDGGVNWTAVDTLSCTEVLDFQVDPANFFHTILATDNGLYRSTSGTGPWNQMFEPFLYGLYQPFDVEFKGVDTILVSSALQPGIFRGVRLMNVWSFSRIENREIGTYLSAGPSQTWYSGCLGYGVFRSTNDGATWTIANNDLCAQTVISTGGGSAIPAATFYFMDFSGIMYQTTDWGLSWNALSRNLLLMGSGIEVAPTNPNVLFASAMDIQISGTTPRFLTIFRSIDAGVSWVEVDSTYLPQDFLITADPNIVLGQCDTFLIRSATLGGNFTPVLVKAQSLTNLAGYDTVFAATGDSTFVSYDRGATWTGLLGVGGSGLAWDQTRKILYIAGGPAYRYTMSPPHLDTVAIYALAASVSPNGNLYYLFVTDTVKVARSFNGGVSVDSEAFSVPMALPGGMSAGNAGVFYYQPFRGMWISLDIAQPVLEGGSVTLPDARPCVGWAADRRGRINIRYSLPVPGAISITVYDLSGRKYLQRTLCPNDGGDRYELDVAGLSPGVYFIRIHSSQPTVFGKFVIW